MAIEIKDQTVEVDLDEKEMKAVSGGADRSRTQASAGAQYLSGDTLKGIKSNPADLTSRDSGGAAVESATTLGCIDTDEGSLWGCKGLTS